MTYRDLLDALNRLSSDPRIHPNTPIDVGFEEAAYHYTNDETERSLEVAPLEAIAIDAHRLVLSSHARQDALAR